jgi:hypothetical protein
MTELETSIADNRAAVNEFVATATSLDGPRWTMPRAPGAWTPAQIVEHVTITYEYSRDVTLGKPQSRSLPGFLRPLLRRFVVDSALKAGKFTRKAKAPGMLKPTAAAPSRAEAVQRLEAAVASFEAAIRSGHPQARHFVVHPFFGRVATTDYLRFQALHTRHHRAQLTST